MNDDVTRRIEACKQNQSYFLDLSGLGLREVPAEISELTQLTGLDLQNNRLTMLPESIGDLVGLTGLDLQSNDLTAVPETIGNLTCLTRLNLRGNRLTTLPETIGNLSQLTKLNLRGNQITVLPDPIGNLTQLEELDIRDNQLTSLPESLGHLVGLTWLDLQNNHLTSLPEAIGNLVGLLGLDLSGNLLTTLPESLGQIPRLGRLQLDNLDLLAPEVSAAAAQGQSSLLNFLRELASSAVTIREAKLILIGEGAVGKTSLLAAMMGERFDANRMTTHGVEVKQLAVRSLTGDVITLNAWDFGGQRTYRPTHQFFFTAPAVYIVAWNPRMGAGAGYVEEWIDLVRRRVGDNVRVHVVATHSGPQQQFGDLDSERLKQIHGDCIAGFHHIDSRTGSGVAELRRTLAATATELAHLERRLPSNWHSFLTALNESGESYLDYARYLVKAEQFGLDERSADSLARVAAELGYWCYYPDVTGLEDLVVLQGDWLSKAVSFVLNDPGTHDRNGLITHAHLAGLWSDPRRPAQDRYHPRLHQALRLLMREYQLAYQVQGSMEEPTSLISQLVPAVKPDLAEWTGYGAELSQQTYIIEFIDGNHRTVIPEGLMYQLITWFHRFSLGSNDYERSRHWSGGLVLDDAHNGRALIQIEDHQLHVTVRAAYPTYMCKLVSNDIRHLVSNWKGLTTRILAPCADQCARPGELWSGTAQFDVALLQAMKSDDIREDYCRKCYKPMPIDALIGEIGILAETSKASISTLLADLAVRIDRIERRVAKEGLQSRAHVTVAADAVVDRMRTELDEQTQQYMRLISDDAAEGPKLFTIEQENPESLKSRVLNRSLKVVLWCEHSRLPVHVLERDPEKGVYRVGVAPGWLKSARPWIGIAAQMLRLGSDFVPAILKLNLDEEQMKAMEDHLKLAELTAKEIASAADKLTEDGNASLDEFAERRDSAPQAGVRILHELLREKDPSFGGLQRVRDRDRYLWVHPRFRYEYD